MHKKSSAGGCALVWGFEGVAGPELDIKSFRGSSSLCPSLVTSAQHAQYRMRILETIQFSTKIRNAI